MRNVIWTDFVGKTVIAPSPSRFAEKLCNLRPPGVHSQELLESDLRRLFGNGSA